MTALALPAILVVDDKPANLLAMRKLLQPLEVEVHEAVNGEEALQKVLAHAPAVILLDVDIPGMDGYEVAETLKEFRETRHIPILFLTAAFKDRPHLLQGYRSGGVDYLEKPIDEFILLSKVRIFLDLYQTKRAQEQALLLLQRSESKFRAMVDHVGIGMTRAGVKDRRILEANQAFANMLGYDSPEELYGKRIEEFSHPDDMRINNDYIEQLRAGKISSFQMEKRYLGRNGRLIWGRLTVTLIPRLGDEAEYMVAAIEEITELRHLHAQLAESESRFRVVANSAPVLIWLAGPDKLYTWFNQRWLDFTGRSMEQELGNGWAEGVHPEDMSRCLAVYYSHFDRRLPFVMNYRLRRHDGQWRWLLDHGVPRYDEQGLFLGYIGSCLDVSEQRQVESDLLRAKEEAETANRAKSEFLANMSHEIRTPMNAILGMADLLWESELHPDQRKFMQIFRSAGENLLSIINDVLDLSKIEAGHLQLECVPLNLTEEIEVVCDIMAQRAQSKGVQLVHHLQPEVPEWLVGDPTRLRQIFLNLLSDAVKFTEQGSILFSAKYVGKRVLFGSERVAIQFRIEDSGIGIAADRLHSIFDHFVQADSSITRRYGGTGLGLAIVKSLVHKMAGQIEVESHLGQGSTFFVTIPFEVGQQAQAQRLPDLQGMRVLIVDDVEANRIVFRENLEQMQAVVAEAADGVVALEMMERALAEKRPFQLLLLDVRMPVMDGFQLLECWNAIGHQGIPILMLSSEHQESYLQRCEELGVRHYLIKPVRRADLLRIIRQITQIKEEKGAASLADEEKGKRTVEILLVEDSEDNRLLIATYLRGFSCHLQSAENGVEALERLRQQRYDVVLMDVQMPVMDGYTATRAWRRLEEQQGLPHVPIIALTAHAMPEDIAHSLQAGCDAHLAKPVRKKSLWEMIERFVFPE
ncbi:response regulator [Candidatus Magnetaquicoccus inordinatus]|uniref:response regulator n=1 Tax=Candidatus Magnetaquicoccus inordinatus TaxID=2496818 RepID=UPI00102B9978|nr:response regulator [Candidatus Magnetaquicoccus inordinatus]